MSKSAWRNGTRPTFHFAASAGSVISSKFSTRDFFTAKTVSDSMNLLSATKMCVVSGRCPGAEARSGPYNLTAPNPVTDAELTAALKAAFHRPDFPWLRVPAPLLKLGLGEMSSELLNSARVLPKRLLDAGFVFEYPTVAAALKAELAAPAPAR